MKAKKTKKEKMEDQVRSLIQQILSSGNRMKRSFMPSLPAGYEDMFHCQQEMGGKVTISVVSDLQLCKAHASKAGCTERLCNQLHICRFFFLDTECTFGEKCKFGHSLQSVHNLAALMDRLLDWCSLDEVLCLVRSSNKQSTFPLICKFYNVGNGCTKGDRCIGLHVCKHFMTDECTFGDKCKRSHDIFDTQPRALLEKAGVNFTSKNTGLVRYVKKQYKSESGGAKGSTQPPLPSASPGPRPVQQVSSPPYGSSRQGSAPHHVAPAAAAAPAPAPAAARRMTGSGGSEEEICMFHLRGACLYAERCRKHHSSVPYLWQIKINDVWENLSDENSMLEENFSDPDKENYCLANASDLTKVRTVSFADMQLRMTQASGLTIRSDVRRVSTMSTVKALPTNNFTTKWNWYWKDDAGKWQAYGGVYEHDLEEVYLDNVDVTVEFSFEPYVYAANLKKMEQLNIQTGTKREIRRRPSLVSKQDVKMTLAAEREPKKGVTAIDYPTSWQPAPPGGEMKACRLIKLSPNDAEYKDVCKLFQETAKQRVTAVLRIQNMELWEEYTRKKSKMEKKMAASKHGVKEKQLFHGTHRNLVEAICQQGFDWRVSGMSTGTLYGKGSYFARDAKYSTDYTDCRQLFVVRVLVGDHCQGKRTDLRPPPKDASKPLVNFYDTCVNNQDDPSIFVAFEQAQAYPEYIVEYQ